SFVPFIALLSFISWPASPLVLPSFPTRRSSDLADRADLVLRGELPFGRRVAHPGGQQALVVQPGGLGGGADRAQADVGGPVAERSEEHTSELQSRFDLVCRLLLEKKRVFIRTSI